MAGPSGENRRLAELGIKPGDEIQVLAEDREFSGILMPHHDFSQPDILTLKLESGYNVGIRIAAETTIRLLRKSDASRFRPPHGGKGAAGRKGELTKVAFVGTGGTIASFVDYRTGGVFPAMDASGLVSIVPELSSVCRLEGKNLFSVFSENMGREEWASLANEVADRLNEGYAGVLVSHGTDTMSYTAAALSFMLPSLTGPVALVGAQRSPDRPSFDGYLNLVSAARVASSTDIGEVVVVMHASSSDRGCSVHRGTKVRKMHSSRRDAFRSINDTPIAFVDEEVRYLSDYRKKSEGKVHADTGMVDDVLLLQFYPDMKAEDFLQWSKGRNGVVIAGTGLGHVSSRMVGAISKRAGEGMPVVVTTQCLYGSVDFNVYATGRDLIRAGAIDGKDMLPEVAYIKLRHVLAHEKGEQNIRRAMGTGIAGEFNERRKGDDEF